MHQWCQHTNLGLGISGVPWPCMEYGSKLANQTLQVKDARTLGNFGDHANLGNLRTKDGEQGLQFLCGGVARTPCMQNCIGSRSSVCIKEHLATQLRREGSVCIEIRWKR